MDDHRFDAFTRSPSSRRTALGGLLGGVATLLGLALPEEAEAHNFLPRCRKIKDAPRRRACIRRARAHNRKHALSNSTPPPCVSQSLAITCGPGCGVRVDNCGRLVTCSCAPNQVCLNNGTCALSCAAAACPAPCDCLDDNVCLDQSNTCGGALCGPGGSCPRGFKCFVAGCDEDANGDTVFSSHCIPVC